MALLSPIGLRQMYLIDNTRTTLLQQSQAAPDIEYTPDPTKYHNRTSARIRAGNLEKGVPSEWPLYLKSPLAWTGADFENENSYVHHLSDEEKTDIDQALDHFNALDLNGDEVNRQTFPLTILSLYLEKSRHELSYGKGFLILRGLNPKKYSAEDITVIFLGVSSYISERRGKQDQSGRMLTHIVDCAISCNRAGLPPTKHSSIAQPFHTDNGCDIIGMLSRSCPAKGGRSILASSWTVYNELAATRPDLVHVLAKADWPTDNFGRDPQYVRRALLYYQDPNIIFSFARPPLTGHHATPRSPGIPSLTEAQAEALDAVHFVAQSHQLVTTIEPGDIRFINNLGLLHGREAFHDEQDRKRHLVRLWLRIEKEAWPLPPTLKPVWSRVFDIAQKQEVWEIEPPTTDWKVIRHFGSHGD